MTSSTVKTRTLIAHVEDKPGVLNRIASLFRRRAFNIVSLTVGRTNRPGVSRVTLVMETDDDTARRIEANLYKLVNVLLVEDVTFSQALTRELALIKVRARTEQRAEVLKVIEVFRARVVDMSAETMAVEITGSQDKIDGLIDVLRPYSIVEMVRTGVVAMTRGEPQNLQEQGAGPGETQWQQSSTTKTPISA
jgi:acetolactate synthase I/III small subunit